MAAGPLVGGQIVYDYKKIKWTEHVTASYLDTFLGGLQPGGRLPDFNSSLAKSTFPAHTYRDQAASKGACRTSRHPRRSYNQDGNYRKIPPEAEESQ
jgi:hypothetical protein